MEIISKLLETLCITPILICIAVPAGLFGFMLISVPERAEIKLLGIPFLSILLVIVIYGLASSGWLDSAYDWIIATWYWAIVNWKQLSLTCIGSIIISLVILFFAGGNFLALFHTFLDILLLFIPSVLLASTSAGIASFMGEVIKNYDTPIPSFDWRNETGILVGAIIGGISLLIAVILNIRRSQLDDNFASSGISVLSAIISSVVGGAITGAMKAGFWGGLSGAVMGVFIGSISILRIRSGFWKLVGRDN